MFTNHLRQRAVAAAAGLLVTGLVSGIASAPAPAAPSRAAQAAAISVSISAKHVLTMPTTIRPGVNKFVVSSVKDGAFQLLTLAAGYTPAKFADDINAAFGKNDVKALKRFEKFTILLGGVASPAGGRGKGWFNVPEGTIYALDTKPRVTDAAKMLAITVTGDPTGALLPAGPKLKAIQATTWAARPASIPAKGILRFKNAASNNHFVLLVKLAKGKTVKDFATWVDQITQGQNGPPPFDPTEPGVDSGVLDPGQTMALRYKLSPGNYVLTCFWPDASMGGMPHAFMGMFRGIKVK